MRLWRRLMMGLARSEAVTDFMQERAPVSDLARRFVGGEDQGLAIATAQRLSADGIRSSLFHLGEYVDDPMMVRMNTDAIVAVAEALGQGALDVHVSVDPTQIGYSLDAGMGRENAERIGAALAAQPARPRNALMLDMEDFAMVETTIALHDALVEADVPTAITLQAYLRRTEDDLARLAGAGATVRLVKGAFAESAARAFTGRRRITENYLRLAGIMLGAEARAAGFTPLFGTHDDAVIRDVAALARENGWPNGSFEFEMLYGVRPALLKSLAEAGHAVRVYLPFGRDWWPYAARRVGENFANARFVARALLGR